MTHAQPIRESRYENTRSNILILYKMNGQARVEVLVRAYLSDLLKGRAEI